MVVVHMVEVVELEVHMGYTMSKHPEMVVVEEAMVVEGEKEEGEKEYEMMRKMK